MIVQCDFDGTITTNNLSVLLRQRFATGGWQRTESDFLQGRLTVEQSNRKQYAFIKERREVLQEFARQNVEVRSGFLQFVEHCRAAGIRFVIVSSGLDFYIEAVLRKFSTPHLELYCARTSFGENGIVVTYTDPEGNIVENGFKARYLTWLRSWGEPIVYVGDGLSDFDAACGSDYVFAIDHLDRLLETASVPHYTFSGFSDIWRQMCHLEGS